MEKNDWKNDYKPGDLIAVASYSTISVGIFVQFTPVSMQYYYISDLSHVNWDIEEFISCVRRWHLNNKGVGRKPIRRKVSYINACYRRRIRKITEDCLTLKERKMLKLMRNYGDF